MAERIAADEEQRRMLAETLPPGTAADKVIRKLECSKRRLLESRANRRSNTELKAERAKWQSRIKAWKKVQEIEEPEWWERNPAALGRVDKPDPDSNAGQQHERSKALDELVVSGGDAA
jgi:hypothetical protein